ncbi:serine hydrolase domain-containing protein, partial [Chryseobacterium sp. Alg-005]|uniref:serine hydrolase domain-containing protein n=1 Tax=Chryseobacterium sp. Alg-005 TaxID=3159516 RepID=UPI0036F36CF1
MKKILLTLLFVVSTFSFAQLNKKIDSIIQKEFHDQNDPGGVFLVTKKGKTLFEKAFGKANLELDVNMTPQNVFQIGSMTKQFTAISILILESQGKLQVND